MFRNECIGTITYEATATTIAMAGIVLSFIVECVGMRIVMRRSQPSAHALPEEGIDETNSASHNKGPGLGLTKIGHQHGSSLVDSKLSVLVMESGVIFHSICRSSTQLFYSSHSTSFEG